jgi:hypothetical protein
MAGSLMPTNVMDVTNYVQQQGQLGRQQGMQSRFAKLAGDAYTAPAGDQRNALVGQAVATDPSNGIALGNQLAARDSSMASAQDAHMKKIGGAARYMMQAVKTGNPAAVQGAYQAVRPYLAELGAAQGKVPPEKYDPSMEAGIQQIIAQTGGMPDAKGVVINGSLINSGTGETMATVPYPLQYHDVPMGEGKAAGVFDPANGQVRPAVGGIQGGQAGAQAQPQGDPMQPLIDQANHAIQLGADPAKVQQWLVQQAQSSGMNPQPPSSGQSGMAQAGQFGVGTPSNGGPDSFRAASPAELKMYGLPDNSVAQVNTKTGKLDVLSKPAALSPDKMADVAVKRQKVEQAKQESVATFNDSINKIDSLLADPSFSSLGTFTGDIAGKIPHTDTANAKAQLDTISAQSVINVLSSLKSLSSNGASGFGALSEKEGEILRNAAANLSTSQNNGAIRQNLLDLKKKLERSRDLVSAQAIKLPEDAVGSQSSAPAQGGWAIQRVQ